MESDWLPHMLEVLDIERESLPLIWDADFLYGPRTEAGENTYVLREINVSSVFPIPDQAPEQIARLAANRRRSSRSRLCKISSQSARGTGRQSPDQSSNTEHRPELMIIAFAAWRTNLCRICDDAQQSRERWYVLCLPVCG